MAKRIKERIKGTRARRETTPSLLLLSCRFVDQDWINGAALASP
jgi:hypothetical protein